MDITPSTIFTAIAAAIITGLLTLVGLIISKENKTSEFRQQWIDNLRREVSDFVGHIEVIILHGRWLHEKTKNKSGLEATKEIEKCIESIQESVCQAHSLARSILLRLNPHEHQDIREIMQILDKQLETLPLPTRDETSKTLNRLTEAIQKELKIEWERVKRGEPTFRTTKTVVTIALVAVISALIALAIIITIKPASVKASKTYVKPCQCQFTSAKSISAIIRDVGRTRK
ncbi:MAG: hypothetical protein GJT30_17685 [Geobacter sp.]|nr:hypothetical protein [Geobacter sp.]